MQSQEQGRDQNARDHHKHGRRPTDEQKAGMMRDITQALVKNLGVDADAVVIQINEAPLAHKMKGGKTFVERAAAAKK